MVEAGWLVNIPESIGTKEALASCARFAADVGLAAVTKGVAGKSARAEAEAVLDELIPSQTRIGFAARSGMYGADAAKAFAKELDEAFPNYAERIIAARDKAYAPARFFGAEGETELLKAKGDYKQLLDEARDSMQPVVDRLATKHNFPAPTLSIFDNPELTYRGKFQIARNSLMMNAYNMQLGQTFAGTMYHELSHGEQVSLIAKNMADKIGIAATATPEQRTALFSDFSNGINLERATGRYEWRDGGALDAQRYLDKLIEIRNGTSLTSAQSDRAAQLAASFRHEPDQYTIAVRQALRGKYSDLSDNLKLHLMYRARMHELEAFEMTKLFE